MLVVVVLTIILLFVMLVYASFVKRILREKKQQLLLEINYQKKLHNQSVEIQESERKKIAVQVHDEIGSKLNILSVWLRNPDTWNNERSKEIIAKLIPDLIDTSRNISHSLYPVNLEKFGLILCIEELVSNVEASLSVRFVVSRDYQPRKITVEVQIYRIIQEFLSNVIKHSQASVMTIHIRDSEKTLSILLSDNGKGFKTDTLTKGMGLRNIELRIQSVNASYKWKSCKNKGCRLIITNLNHGSAN